MEEILLQLCAMQRWYKSLYYNPNIELCGIMYDGVHLKADSFNRMFSKYEQRDYTDTHMLREAVYDGVRFYALVEKEAQDAED